MPAGDSVDIKLNMEPDSSSDSAEDVEMSGERERSSQFGSSLQELQFPSLQEPYFPDYTLTPS